MSLRSAVAVVGAGDADRTPGHGRSPLGMAAEATRLALADAGLALADVDGVFTTSAYHGFPGLSLCEYLGLAPRHLDSTSTGGASFVAHLGHAAAAIRAGLCDVALVAFGSTQRSDGGRLVSPAERLAFEQPYGLIHPIGAFGMIARRHMALYGTTSEQLAALAVSAREWARLNPRAPSHEPLTVEDVLSSRVIASPLRKLDCCLVTDGGGAVVLTSAERARDLPRSPVYVRGVGEAVNHRNILDMPDLTTTRAGESAGRALDMAGTSLGEVDTFHVYDAFTISLMVLLEDLGLCAKGEGGAFAESMVTAPGGERPLNPSGGGLSNCHPGMLGLFLVLDAVAQLRGEAGAGQVPSAATSLVHGMGITLAAHASAVLSTEA